MRSLPDKFPSIRFQLVNKPVDEGKGAALKDGFAKVTGDIVIIHDADFEYDPADYPFPVYGLSYKTNKGNCSE